MKILLVSFSASAMLISLVQAANLVGHWSFENAADLTEATVGSALTLNGTTSATTGVPAVTNDDAINVANGTASFITVPNPIGPNGSSGTPTRTNQFTIVLDFQVPDFKDGGADNGNFTGVFDFDGSNTADADYFIRKQANVPELGVSTQWPYVGTGATVTGDGNAGTVRSGTWYRLVLAADGGVGRAVYLNGALVGSHGAGTLDHVRQSIGTSFRVLWDNTAIENSAAIISTIALFDARLTAAEVAILGGAGAPLALPTPTEITWTGGVSGEWSNNVLAAPKNWVLNSDMTTQSDFEDLDTVFFTETATNTVITISNGDVAPAATTFDQGVTNYTLTGTNGIKGAGGLLTQGDGDFRIENANTHSGDTNHASFGDLTLANSNALQNSRLIVYADTVYKFDGITALNLGGLHGDGGSIELANLAATPLPFTLGNSATTARFKGVISGAGSITKIGNGIQALTGANTYTGGTTVTSGILSVGSTSALGTGAVILGGVVDFEIAAGVESTVTNDFTLPTTGTGVLRMFGGFGVDRSAPTPGTAIRLTGKVSGGVAGRTFRFADTNITLEHDNTLIFDNPSNDFIGLIEQWRATLSFTSDTALGNVDNDIKINSGNYNGGLLFGGNITMPSTRSIELVGNEAINSGAFTGTIDGPFTGVGALRKTGAGILKLTNASINYAGVTQVNAGTLQINGTLVSGANAVTVAAAGTLGGTGTIARPVTVNGAISPGASIGTLNVTGNTIINGTHITELDGATTDLLAVTGDLTLGAASALDVNALNPSTTFPYVIATYSGVLSGTFATTYGYIVDYGTGTASQITITVKAPTFEDWATLKGVSGFENDDDGDGIKNGIEFVIGGQPAAGAGSNSTHLLPTSTRDASGNLVFVFRRMPDSAYLLPRVEYSSNLTSWTTYTIPGTVIGKDGDADLVQVTITSALAVGNKIFARLVVENPAN
jgi:autotransporter-associated beta strand protein